MEAGLLTITRKDTIILCKGNGGPKQKLTSAKLTVPLVVMEDLFLFTLFAHSPKDKRLKGDDKGYLLSEEMEQDMSFVLTIQEDLEETR